MLLALLSGLLLNTLSFAEMPCGEPGPGSPDVSALEKLGFDLRQSAAANPATCHRLEKGASAVIQWGAGISPTRVSHSYRLTRTGPRSYKSEVRLNLVPKAGEDLPPGELAKLRGFIQSCLKNQAPLMKGPHGESLEIKLSEDGAVPERKIEVTAGEVREHSEMYSLKSNCPTIIHEVLHLHGLVDEYKEESMGIRTNPKTGAFEYPEKADGDLAFDCRHLGKPESVMRNQWRAVVEARDWDQWEFMICVPGAAAAGESAEGCPPGKHGIKRSQNLFQGDREIEPTLGDGEELSTIPPKKTGVLPKTHDSLLEPAQFLAITRPGCVEENKTYYACSANAYVSSAQARLLNEQLAKGGMMMGLGGGPGAYDPAQLPPGGGMGGMGPPHEGTTGMAGRKYMGGMGPPPPEASKWSFGNIACQETPPECRDPELWSAGGAH